MSRFNMPPAPFKARHVEYSVLASADDEPFGPSDRLFDLALGAVRHARSASMTAVVERMKQPPFYPNVWPGEHYKLLAGLIVEMQPKVVVEIGTSTGLSALAMRDHLPAGSKLVTFDIIPWKQFGDTVLREEDFADGRMSQVIADVGRQAAMKEHEALFQSAELIFADGPKDGRFEQDLINRLGELRLPQKPLVMFDDIRVWNMLAIWRRIQKPKLDITSFGHWSGTGFVDWV
jgi:predicted O-methyltransferase YrrM